MECHITDLLSIFYRISIITDVNDINFVAMVTHSTRCNEEIKCKTKSIIKQKIKCNHVMIMIIYKYPNYDTGDWY